jgi:hypothetical protein
LLSVKDARKIVECKWVETNYCDAESLQACAVTERKLNTNEKPQNFYSTLIKLKNLR